MITDRIRILGVRFLFIMLVAILVTEHVIRPASGQETSEKQASATLTGLKPEYLQVQGLHRAVRLYQPENLAEHPALIIALHGSGGDGERFRYLTDGAFDRLADQHGWLVAYPDALGRQWNDCRANAAYHSSLAGIDDIAFLRAIIRHTKTVTGRDKLAGIFVVGYSNGGHLAFRIAQEAPSEFTALAAIGAHLPVPDENDCTASKQPVPILLVSGTEDPINPWAGGKVQAPTGVSPGRVISAEATATYFRNVAGISGAPVIEQHPDRDINDGTRVETRRWASTDGAEVAMMVVHHGGHALPHPTAPFPTNLVGRVSRDIDGARIIWDFFERQLQKN